MQLYMAIFSMSLLAFSTIVHATTLTPVAAKKMAQGALQVMNEVETYAVVALPERIDSVTYRRKFSSPLERIKEKWPTPWYAPENKAIEPYQICIEAILALERLQMLRLKTTLIAEIEKTRHEYFFDKKPRCETSIRTGKFTERSSSLK